VLIGVGNDAGMFHPASVVAADPKGQDQTIMIPFGRTVNLRVYSKAFQLGDNNGKAVPTAGTTIPLAVAAGSAAAQIRITVTGFSTP